VFIASGKLLQPLGAEVLPPKHEHLALEQRGAQRLDGRRVEGLLERELDLAGQRRLERPHAKRGRLYVALGCLLCSCGLQCHGLTSSLALSSPDRFHAV
jgi:hypothetical protein